MKLSQVKEALKGLNELTFLLEDGTRVPAHFHVTEVGSVKRHFIDCGGTIRTDEAVNFQLWSATDHDHRLAARKLLNIIELSEEKLGLTDQEVEVEYQTSTIGTYKLKFDGNAFILTNLQTDCLAKDKCGVAEKKPKVVIGQPAQASCCTPGGGCC
ncbi:MAG: hypothetical protein H6601_01780 [Flavobacteriales bacterium]|nr:hypothetical protein [Flavobacteriales bacterium]